MTAQPSKRPRSSNVARWRKYTGICLASVAFTAAVTLTGCFLFYPGQRVVFPIGHVPDKVKNFTTLNTPYDDFNAAAPPMIYDSGWLALSSNRIQPEAGNRIHLFLFSINFYKTDGSFHIGAGHRGRLPLAHQAPQFGPLTFWLHLPPVRSTHLPEFYQGERYLKDGHEHEKPVSLIFAGRNEAGDLDLFVSASFEIKRVTQGPEIAVMPAARLNRRGSDQSYAAFGPDGRLYLASDHGGSFDIFAVKGGPAAGAAATGDDWFAWLTETNAPAAELEPVRSVNSTSDDTAPSILDGTMVFASNRPGGQGGFDLYWATYDAASGWSLPTPITIANGPANEFRPNLIVLGGVAAGPQYDNHLLLFSSDRHGGLGGYDMYYVGVVAPGMPVALPDPASGRRSMKESADRVLQ